MNNSTHPSKTEPKPIPADFNFLAPIVIDDLVRLGGMHDGGYVIPRRAIQGSDFLISMGINDDWKFEEDFLAYGTLQGIHAYDHTVSDRIFSIEVLKSLIGLLQGKSSLGEIQTQRKILSSYRSFFTGNVRHFRERVYSPIINTNDADLPKIMDRSQSEKNFLKIDIEGSEYRIIHDLVKYAPRISGIAIEFHDTDPLRLTFLKAMEILLEAYDLVHFHANNNRPIASDGLPDALELTFLRKELSEPGTRKPRSVLPLPGLDAPNNSGIEDYPIVFSLHDHS